MRLSKRIIPFLLGLGLAGLVMAADAVTPQTLSRISWVRGVNSVNATTNTLFTQGASILFTNCTCYSDTAGLTTQGLSSVTVQVGVGNTFTSTWFTATVQDAPNGKFSCVCVLPSGSDLFAYWQVKLTDVNTNIYYYTQQKLNLIAHL